jgi:hypothetical protein
MTAIALVALLVVPCALFGALVTMPYWCMRSLSRDRIWSARDDLVLDILRGRLPAANRSVQLLRARAQTAARDSMQLAFLPLHLSERAIVKNADMLAAANTCQIRASGLTADQRTLFDSHMQRLNTEITRCLMTGSWAGLAFGLVSRIRRCALAVPDHALAVTLR